MTDEQFMELEKELILHSYTLVVKGLKKAERERVNKLLEEYLNG